MSLQPLFDEFDHRISLKDKQLSKMERARTALEAFLVARLGLRSSDVFVQGSYANGTAIEPTDGGEYDLDIVCTSVPAGISADRALNDMADVLASNGNYAPRISPPRPACVRLEYAEDEVGKFHIDVVPVRASETKAPLDAPRREEGWHGTAPAEYTVWCARQGPLFMRTVKGLKRWRDEHQTVRGAIKSIVLQVLIAECMPDTPDDAVRIAQTLRNLRARLDENETPPVVRNPVLLTENLARRWTNESYSEFRAELKEAVDLADRGLSADEVEAIEAWRELLGPDFPEAVANSLGIRLGSDAHARSPSSKGWTVSLDPRYRVEIRATEQRGHRRATARRYESNGTLLFHGKNLKFQALVSGPRDAEVWWQVANTGAHARERQGLRGEFFKGKDLRGNPTPDETVNWEATSYTGSHWIQASLVKADVVVARSDRFLVNIYNPGRRFGL